MAKIKNPRKAFMWSVQFVGKPINPYLFQKLNMPEKEVEVVAHGDVNRDVKTAGRAKIGNLTVEKLLTTSGSDTYMWDWLSKCQNTLVGGGLTPEEYWETILVSELAEDGVSVLNQWELVEVFPFKVNGQTLDRMSSDNSIETIEFAVGDMHKL